METMRNKLLACGTAALMLMTALPLQTALPAFAAEAEAAKVGDVNGDGRKDSADLDALKALLAARPDTVIVEDETLVPYDVTQDGFVDARDTYALSQYVTGAAKEFPAEPGKRIDEQITMALEGGTCFPGDEVQLTLSFVDWTKDIAAYDITLGFDPVLELQKVDFIADDCQYVGGRRTVKLTGLHKEDPLHRGDFAVLTFKTPKEYDGDYTVAVESANIFRSDYNHYTPVRTSAAVTVYPLCEPVAVETAGVGSRSVSLTWDMPFTDQPVTGYRVYRGGEMIAETTELRCTDKELEPDTEYVYTVSAVTASGAETAESVPVTVRTAAPKIRSAGFPAETVSDADSDLTVRLEQAALLSALKLDITAPDGSTLTESADLGGEAMSTVSWHWDVSKLADGTYTVGITVTDPDGASDTAETAVQIVNAPLKPVTLRGTAGDRTAVLTWDMADEAAVTGYAVYRLNDDGRTWEKIAEVGGRNTLTYTDKQLKDGKQYTYAVTSRDGNGQESPKSDSVKIVPDADDTPPEITLFRAAGGQRVSGELTVSVAASDDNGVASVRCEISADEGRTWKTVGEAEGDSGRWIINTADYADGVYRLRAMAADNDKNESSGSSVAELAFDNTAPEQVRHVRAVSVTEKNAAIAWDNVSDEDFSYFTAIISDSTKTWEQKADKTLGINLADLTPDTLYTVTVYAVDAAGNAGVPSEPFSFISTSDTTPPTVSSLGLSSEYASANAALTVKVTAKDQSPVTYCYVQYSQDQKEWKELRGTGAEPSLYISDRTLTEGPLYIRAYAEDKYGNKGDPEQAQIRTVTVDNEAPAAPEKLTAETAVSSNLLTWSKSASEDAIYYRVERAVGGEYTGSKTVADKCRVLSFEDTDVEADGTYYYRVYAVDRAGNLSPAASSGKVKRVPDTEKPQILECGLSVQLAEPTVCSAHRTLQIVTSDNTKLKAVTAAYRCSESAEWTALAAEEQQANRMRTELVVRTELPESVLKEESVTVQVTAEDAAGNKAVQEYRFRVDDSRAEIRNAAAKLDEKQVTVSWECPDTAGVSAFYLYRRIGTAGREYCLSQAVPQQGQTEYSLADPNLSAGGRMIYRIQAEMKNGNTVSVTLDPIDVQAVPKASLEYTPSQVVGAEYRYDASGSQNAADIVSVAISFGDATEQIIKKSAEDAVFTHKYERTGDYQVTLTVTNASGMSDTKTVTVTVAEKSVMANVNVHVRKMDGSAASYATVFADPGTDRQVRYQADADGNVTVECTAGGHEFGVFADGCLPGTKYCSLAPDSSAELNFTLVQDELVSADFEVSRMTLAEIKAAGIDVEDPENCQMVMIDVSLSYSITTTVTDHVKVYYDSGSGRTWLGGGSGTGGSGSSDYHYEIQTVSRDVSTVVLLRVPAKAQFLKEFFKVDMIVMNNADPTFSLTDCVASLNLPGGLSVAEDAPASRPRVTELGTIRGGQQQTVSWIVRGDRSGTYNFSADFSGTLQPFNEHISMNFAAEQPITVEGQEAASVTVNFDPVIRKKNMFVEMLVENNTAHDLYELSTEIGKAIADTVGTAADGEPRAEIYQTRFTGTDGILQVIEKTDQITALHPGEKFSVVYRLKNVVAQDIRGTYKDVQSSISATSSARNTVVQIQPVRITDINDPGYGINLDPDTQFILICANKNGVPIANAKVELGKFVNNGKSVIASGTTDASGRLVVPRACDEERLYVEAHAEGYRQYYNSRYEIPKKASDYYDILTMSGDLSGADYSLRYVALSGTDRRSLLTQKYTVNTYESETFSIIGASNDPAVKYELIQRGETRPVKSTAGDSGTFAFMELTPSMFTPGKAVFIRMTTETGDTVEKLIGLDVIAVNEEEPLSNPDIAEFADVLIDYVKSNDWCCAIPMEWMPDFIEDGLQDLVLDFAGELKAVTDSDALNSIGITHDLRNDNDKKTGVDQSRNIGVSLTRDDQYIKVNVEFTLGKTLYFGKKDLRGVPSQDLTIYMHFTATAVYNHINCEWTSLEPTFKAHLVGTGRLFHYEKPVAGWFLDVFYKAEVTIPIVNKISIINSADSVSLRYDDVYVPWNGKIGVRIDAGLKAEVFDLEIAKAYIRGTSDFILKKRQEHSGYPFDSVSIDGDARLRIDVGGCNFLDLDLISGSTLLWESPKPGSSPRPPVLTADSLTTADGTPVSEAVKDASRYQPYTADMIPQAGVWHAQLGGGLTELQSGISGGSAPGIVSDGTNTVMVWIVKDIARGVNNASYAVWSRYDSSARTWSEPKPVDDNGNADTTPVLFAGADGIRLAYLESAAVYADDSAPSLDEYVGQLVAKTAKFDAEADAFTDFRTAEVNADGGFASVPAFAQAADGTTYLFRSAHTGSSLFSDDGTARILCAKETADGWETPAVLAENPDGISAPVCGQNAAGEPVFAYTVSEPAEDNARALYLAGLSGEPVKLASGDIASPRFAEIPGKNASGLVWYQDGSIYASADLTEAELLCSGEDCGVSDRFVTAGDRILFLSNSAGTSALYSTRYDAESGSFTVPVCVESGEHLYYETLSVANAGGETLYAMARTDDSADMKRPDTSLVGGVLGETVDLCIAETAYTYSDAKPGRAFPIAVAVRNDGTAAVDAVTLRILDGTGKAVASETKEIRIQSGHGAPVQFAPVLPAALAPAEYTVSVSAADTDKTPDNNTAVLDLTMTDLAVDADLSYIGDSTFVTILASNLSGVPASAVITIRPQRAEEETVTLFSDPIAPHSSAYWRLNAEDLLGDLYADTVEITVSADTEDGDETNNTALAFIAKSGMDPYKTGDINLDGKVELEDVTLALKCYTMQVANRKDTGLNDMQQNAADVNRDGAVDVIDVMTILKFYVFTIAGKAPASFPEFLENEQNGGANHESE
ncbi:MAG: fibronectin type III domain-containing protein [Oscillospiraceae bacterium]|nr:fibronectin type III domain-containing protein [Oscillospiraceae bacterium]